MFTMMLLLAEEKLCDSPEEEVIEYNQENDDIRSILAHACDRLEEMKVLKFLVSGFGQDRWAVDVRFDLLIVLEQIESVCLLIKQGLPTKLDFPEQGLERSLNLTPADNILSITCTSFGRWKASNEVISMELHQFCQLLADIACTFLKAVRNYCPSDASHPWFAKWEQHLLMTL